MLTLGLALMAPIVIVTLASVWNAGGSETCGSRLVVHGDLAPNPKGSTQSKAALQALDMTGYQKAYPDVDYEDVQRIAVQTAAAHEDQWDLAIPNVPGDLHLHISQLKDGSWVATGAERCVPG